MGLDRFANFISKSINGDGIDEINIDNNMRKIVSNHIIFDLNFLIYQEIVDIENEINDIIKIILCLPFAPDKNEILEELLKSILTQKHWNSYYISTDLENLFDGFNEDEIVQKFINFISSKITSSYYISNEINSLSILELVIYEKITTTLINYVEHIHHTQFIQTLSIFYDGIPSISKVIEQRRRRIKNFLESNEKKGLFKIYFEKLINNNKNLFENLSKNYMLKKSDNPQNLEHVILFDYFKWVKNRFSIDKSIGPSSNFIKNLELFMNIRLTQKFSKKKILINSAKDNGESDLKIFKYISSNEINGDYCIHTIDSDLIHQILVQQTYYKIINKDINFTVIKYIKNYTNLKQTIKLGLPEVYNDSFNNLGYIQVLESNLLVKNILELYNNLNGIKTNNYKIVWDLCLIFYLFGNDHLPSSVEIGPELGLDFFIKKHYQALNKLNIINLKKSHIVIDLSCLKIYLEKINETNIQNITRIILIRFYKININLINLLVDKLTLDFNQILKFLEVFITILGKKMEPTEFNLLDESDLRKHFVTLNKLDDLTELGFDESKIKLVNDNLNMIQENINFYEHDFNGLILYSKLQNITIDPYQDLYNFISDKATANITKKYPIYYDHLYIDQHLQLVDNLKINLNQDSNDYLKKIYHLVLTQFGNMNKFHSDNLTWYKYLCTPSIINLIKYINEIPPDINQTKNWLIEIKNENVSLTNYLNSINHHLLITPFMSFYNVPPEIIEIISELEIIDNLWLDQDNLKNFNYRSIDIIKFFKNWNDALMRISLNSKTNKINEEIINLNLEFI